MYTYTLELVPSKKYPNLDYTQHKTIFEESCIYINRGLAFTRDQKEISIQSIKKDQIKVKLCSANPLQNPARSISALTRYLTSNYSEIFKEYVYNKTLFIMKLTDTIEDPTDSTTTITDAEMLKAIIDLTVDYTSKSASETAKRKRTLDQIKELVKPYINTK